MLSVDCPEHSVGDPQEGLVSSTHMSDPNTRVKPLVLQPHNVRAIYLVLFAVTALERQVKHLHRDELVIERFETLPSVPLDLPLFRVEVGHDHTHGSEFDNLRDDPSSARRALSRPVKLDLARKQERAQLLSGLVTYAI